MWKNLFRDKKLSIVAIICIVFRSLFEVGLAGVLKIVINTVVKGYSIEIIKIFAISIAYILIASFLNYFAAKYRRLLIKNCSSYLREEGFKAIMKQSLNCFYSNNQGKYMNMLTKDIEILEESYFNVILDAFTGIIQFIVATIIMFIISPFLGIFIIVMTLLQILLPKIKGNKIADLNNKYIEKHGDFLYEVKEEFGAIRIVKEFDIFKFIYDKYRIISKEDLNLKFKFSIEKYKINELSFFLGQTMYIGTFCIGALLALKNVITISSIIAASQLMTYVAYPLMKISNYLLDIISCKDIIENYNSLFSNNKFNVEINNRVDVNELKTNNSWEELVLKDVRFGYDNDTILQDINLSFHHGGKYIIVGESGAGKSTLINLMTKMYCDYSGEIRIDKKNIKDIKDNDYFSFLGVVEQFPYIFDDTMWNNVTLFSEIFSKEEVINAIESAGLKQFLEFSNYDLNKKVGELGNKLSGGQRQRLGISRVLLRKPNIIILDEGTSNLDNQTAFEIEKMLLEQENVTTILAMHRLNPQILDIVTQVIVIDNGRIVEKGTYKELLDKKGYLYSLMLLE